MKKIIGMIGILLFLGVFFVGCSTTEESTTEENIFSEQQEFRENFNKEGMQNIPKEIEGIQKEGDFNQDFDRQRFRDMDMNNSNIPINDRNRPMGNERFGDRNPEEFNEEQMMQMREEMQQKMIEVCEGKSEGDECTMENPMGEMKGTCTVQDENLLCMMERPEMPMR